MEALPDNLLMQTAAIVGGDDEMIDSEYDQIVANDDDYDIDLDTGENLSNTGDEEMKFDEEVATYDNDDLMLDEADYATTAQEEMIITQLNQSDTGTFLNIDMNAHGTTEVDATQSTQMEALVGTMVGMNEHHVFTQETQHEAITDSYIHSQHDFASTAQVQPTPAVDQKLQPDLEQVEQPEQPNEQTETETEPAATAEITNPEPSADVTSTDTDYTEAATTEVVHEVPVDQTPAVDSNTQEYPEAQGDSLKIHPIIVQFEANTLSLFNSVHYINYANPDDSPENAYPEVPSVFLLSDASFYSKGFDELFSGLRELFGTTIGDDAEITMDFVGLELFLHEDNLLTKSISLSDLIDLHLRLSKQDGVERPEPLYIILSTQPRFTKRYSELLTAAGEGKGLSQISTYSPTNDYTTAVDADGNAVHSPEDEFATAEEAAQGNSTSGFPTKNVDDIDQADHFSEAEPVQQPVSVAGEAGNITSAENDNVPQPQVEVQNEAVQQGEEEYVEEEEEELLPAEDEPQYIGDVVENGQEKPENTPAQPEEEPKEPDHVTEVDQTEKIVDTNAYAEPVQQPAVADATHDEQTEANPEGNTETEVTEEYQSTTRVTTTLVEGLVNNAEEELLEYEEVEEQGEVEEPHEVEISSEFQHTNKSQPAEAEASVDDASAQEEDDFPEEVPLDEYQEIEDQEEEYPQEEGQGDDYQQEEGQEDDYQEDEEHHQDEAHPEEFTEDDSHADEHEDGDVQDDNLSHESPETAQSNYTDDQYSPAEPTTHVDDESFSSATVVEAEDGHSSHEEEGPSPGENSEVANTSAETTHQRIQVHQFDDADSEAGDADAPTEDENIYALGVEGEEYTYEEETWQHNVDEILEHDPEYYQDGYVDGEYTEGDVLNGYVAEEEFTEENGDHYGGNENGNSEDDTTYPDAEGYEETETYEVFPQEVSEYDGVPGVRSPTAKRLREDEADPLDVQDIKRTRSH